MDKLLDFENDLFSELMSAMPESDLMESFRQLLQPGSQERLPGPLTVHSIDLPPPWLTRMRHMKALEQYEQERINSPSEITVTVHTTTRPPLEHGPAPPFETLKPTSLKMIAKKINSIHHDKVLFVKTCCKPMRFVGTSILVEVTVSRYLSIIIYRWKMILRTSFLLAPILHCLLHT
jgi:hypothetical protein